MIYIAIVLIVLIVIITVLIIHAYNKHYYSGIFRNGGRLPKMGGSLRTMCSNKTRQMMKFEVCCILQIFL